MITFKAFLAELFDKAVPFKHDTVHSDHIRTVYTFRVDDTPYFIVFEPIAKTTIEVSFGIGEPQVVLQSFFERDKAFKQTHLDKHKFVVFSTVIEAAKQFIQTLPSGFEITFTAEGESRIKMYRLLATKLATKYNTRGY